MKKAVVFIAACIVLLSNFLLPIPALAAGESTQPPLPMEKVLGKTGKWYNEYVNYDNQDNLVIGFLDKEFSTSKRTVVSVGESSVLTAMYIPFIDGLSEKKDLKLIDERGNVYSGFSVSSTDKLLIFEPLGHMVLKKSSYSISFEDGQMLPNAVLLKGYNTAAFDRYEKKLLAWYAENHSEQNDLEKEMGNISSTEEKTDIPSAPALSDAEKKPAKFQLDSDYVINEIRLNTYNKGDGALPGYVTIYDGAGKIAASGKAYGAEFGGAQNGMWIYAPNVILKAGIYSIKMTEPDALSYEEDGTPMFYVSAVVPIPVRYDFTGTYNIKLDTYKRSTLKGNVNSGKSEFSLKDFELTILDCDGYIELIGQYEGMPFSQICEITEETETRLAGKFNFNMDLSKLPYKARIGADAKIVLEYSGNKAVVSINGSGFYKREANESKGADDNTYAIISRGELKHKELSPFVMTALAKPQNIGNIPGPDKGTQAAVGMLFPPLAGVVVTVVMELLNRKPKAAAPRVNRDKNWYKNKYPDKTDEQIAMIMLADAMSNTDNPDEGDAISVGDNEVSGTDDSGGQEYESDETEQDDQGYSESEYTPDEPEFVPENEPTTSLESTPEPTVPTPVESRDITDPVTGNTTTYVKDPASGEWYNPETGYAYSEDAYKEAQNSAAARDDYQTQARVDNAAPDENMKAGMDGIKQKEQQEEAMHLLQKKYGTDDMEEIKRVVEKQQNRDMENFKEWQKYADRLETAETVTQIAGMGADTAIDLMGTAHPGIKNGYKIIKNMAGTAASDYAAGKGIGLGTIAEGAIKSATDVGSDYIDVTAKYGVLKKAGAAIVGETAAVTTGAALRGEDVAKAAQGGLVDGILNAGVGAVTDGITAKCPPLNLPEKGLAIGSAIKAIGGTTHGGAQKMGSAAIKEFIIKPYTDQLK
ncbi:hypothetical protein [Desulfosporosinus burensis]